LFLLLKTTQQPLHKNTVSRNEEKLSKSFDSSDMMYLMPDRFANGNNNNDSENNTKRKTQQRITWRKTILKES
jgi:hypothetical protein